MRSPLGHFLPSLSSVFQVKSASWFPSYHGVSALNGRVVKAQFFCSYHVFIPPRSDIAQKSEHSLTDPEKLPLLSVRKACQNSLICHSVSRCKMLYGSTGQLLLRESVVTCSPLKNPKEAPTVFQESELEDFSITSLRSLKS